MKRNSFTFVFLTLICFQSNISAQTIIIGTQTWCSKNLDVSKYRNGDTIPYVQDVSTWKSLTTGAWCYYLNDPINGTKYGKLYNWFAVNDPRGLVPKGYHMPTNIEWKTLIQYLGPTAAQKLLISNGFGALRGGNRDENGMFYADGNPTYLAQWWSSSSNNNSYSWLQYLVWSNIPGFQPTTFTLTQNKKCGLSVRCIKD